MRLDFEDNFEIFFVFVNENRAVGKKEYLVMIRNNFCQFCTKICVMTRHLNHLVESSNTPLV